LYQISGQMGWFRANEGERSPLVEVLCDAFLALMGQDLEVRQIDHDELVAMLLNHALDTDDEPNKTRPPAMQGYMEFCCVVEGLDPTSQQDWQKRWFVLGRDREQDVLFHFANPQQMSEFLVQNSSQKDLYDFKDVPANQRISLGTVILKRTVTAGYMTGFELVSQAQTREQRSGRRASAVHVYPMRFFFRFPDENSISIPIALPVSYPVTTPVPVGIPVTQIVRNTTELSPTHVESFASTPAETNLSPVGQSQLPLSSPITIYSPLPIPTKFSINNDIASPPLDLILSGQPSPLTSDSELMASLSPSSTFPSSFMPASAFVSPPTAMVTNELPSACTTTTALAAAGATVINVDATTASTTTASTTTASTTTDATTYPTDATAAPAINATAPDATAIVTAVTATVTATATTTATAVTTATTITTTAPTIFTPATPATTTTTATATAATSINAASTSTDNAFLATSLPSTSNAHAEQFAQMLPLEAEALPCLCESDRRGP